MGSSEQIDTVQPPVGFCNGLIAGDCRRPTSRRIGVKYTALTVFDVDSSRLVTELTGHAERVLAAAHLSDGQRCGPLFRWMDKSYFTR